MTAVSIVIPTCNRSDFLLTAVNAILAHAENTEIIISDNSYTDDIKKLLTKQISSGAVRYQYIPNPVSVVENFECAVAMATGEFVMCIGDDDCIGPGFNEIVTWAQKNDVDAIFSYGHRFIANYFWPKVISYYFGQGYEAKLFLKKYTGRISRINGLNELKNASRNFGVNLGLMPRVYHGLVKRSLLDHIRNKYGSIFGGVSPDIYSCTLLSFEAHKIYQIDVPFIIPGASPKSTAGEGAAHKDRANLFEVDHIRRFGSDLKWSSLIPEYYGPHNVWGYSMLCALNRIDALDINPNFMRLILKGWLGDRKYKEQLNDTLHAIIKHQGYSRSLYDSICAVGIETYLLLRRIYWKFICKTTIYKNVIDIGQALDLLIKEEKNSSFDLTDRLKKDVN
jgi:glycosyltransferase involved in cell wall biosynthesis